MAATSKQTDIKLSNKDKRVIAVLLADASNLSGWPLAKLSKTSAARVYVVLARLERAELVTSEWEDGPNPRRRFYRLTPEGRSWALNALGLKD